ncbi:peptidylprolyl isomerase, partial [Acidisphaera rubrifaciens]|uniref:peptidylprolyl isomerase n=1 Tax=Acidisphaera rubrifaciens TaxID=50715 RepID=UPI0006627044
DSSTPPAAPPGAATGSATDATAKPATDPLLATVNGAPIHLSDVQDAMRTLPQQARTMPQQILVPMLVDQLIDRQALVITAKKQGLDKDPAVQAQIQRAADQALQRALLQRDIGPLITDDALKAAYEKDYANKPGQEEVHASHILVEHEAEAKDIIAQLEKGADFAALAKAHSKDPGASQGGDLGWFKKDDMVPEFSAAAFALKPGEFTKTPVHTQFGWHVIKVTETRIAKPPTFDSVRDELRQHLIQDAVQKLVKQARADVKVVRFNMDGTPEKPTDSAEPPPAPSGK